jgi:dCMP deaminase
MKKFYDYIPPSKDEWFMKQVYLTAERSKDPSSKIGAVLVKDGNIIGSGYNGFSRKVLDLPERYNNRETKYKFVVHSEVNAILTCARMGISTLNSVLYTNSLPCHNCMKEIIQAGIKEVVIHKQWSMNHSKWKESIEISQTMLKEAEISVRELDKILGMVGYLNGEIINI